MGLARLVGLAAALCAVVGCASSRPRLVAALAGPAATPSTATAAYVLACPDALDVAVTGRPDLTGRFALEADGAIRIGSLGRVRLDGSTPADAALRLASAAGTHPQYVRIAVAEYRSRQIFLMGAGSGRERAFPYQGPETVVEFLRRAGGLGEAANPADVHVVRSHVASGRRPEVFPVDLEAILLRNDPKTNVPLEPYDQVYVGETQFAGWSKHLPFTASKSPPPK